MQVATTLFQALSTIPYLSQISYIGLDGLFFTYYTEGNQLYALYSNSTLSLGTENYTWYMQPANRDTGKLYGEAIKSPPFAIVNSTWFEEALNSSNVYASIGTGWGTSRDILFLSTVGMDGKGAVSLGFSMKFLIDFLIDEIAFYKGSLYLATTDGNLLTQGIPNTRMILMAGNRVSFKLLGHDDDQVSEVEMSRAYPRKACSETLYLAFGAGSISLIVRQLKLRASNWYNALALPQNNFSSRIHKNIRLAFVLLILMIGDRGKLKQILSNLLSNAVKFTSEGHVIVRAWARKPSLRNVSNRRKGIPKEKQKSVFENYVQVKETALGQEGTGLGLGIVQSLVRLMGGEIGIVDKEIGERGSCFRFNVLLSTCEPDICTNATSALDIEANNGDYISGPIIRIHMSPKTERSQVLLFIQSVERSKVVQNFMQRLGIRVHVVKQHQQLSPALKKIKRKLNLSHHSSWGKSDGNSTSDEHASCKQSKEVPLSSLDGIDDILPSQKRLNAWGSFSGFVMVVIETRADASNSNFQGLDEDKLPLSDLVISAVSRISFCIVLLRFLPENLACTQPRRGERSHNVEKVTSTSYVASKSGVNGKSCVYQKSEIEEVGGSNNKKPLMGKKILVADDDPIGRKIATFVVSQLGANIFSCENGEEAWKLVCKSLDDGTNVGASKDSVPFDCILMDCEMAVMDGIEATRRIREAEEIYGVHTPIIALTAHSRERR
ncbi:hypothetical protein DH2020_000984 [Rehmannia glutinosa]|uniref:histidine kinase n=1 Tax=Rehmannia glutinosa TaxID=99300 RepID=A0ABR0XYR6_REHGL